MEYEDYVFPGEEQDPVKRRKNLLEKMTPSLREQVKKVEKRFDRSNQDELRDRYDLGLIVKEIHDDDQRGGQRYGKDAVSQLERYFPWGKSTLRSACRLVEEFTRDEIDKVCTMRTGVGEPVSYTHLRSLMAVSDKKLRWELLERVVKENLTVDDLDRLVIDSHGERVPPLLSRKRGRPMTAPKNFEGVIRQQEGYCQDFLERSFRVWEDSEYSLGARAESLSPQEIKDEHARKVKELADLMRKVARKAQERADEAQKVHDYLQTTLKQRFGWADKVKKVIPPRPRVDEDVDEESEDLDEEETTPLVAA